MRPFKYKLLKYKRLQWLVKYFTDIDSYETFYFKRDTRPWEQIHEPESPCSICLDEMKWNALDDIQLKLLIEQIILDTI